MRERTHLLEQAVPLLGQYGREFRDRDRPPRCCIFLGMLWIEREKAISMAPATTSPSISNKTGTTSKSELLFSWC